MLDSPTDFAVQQSDVSVFFAVPAPDASTPVALMPHSKSVLRDIAIVLLNFIIIPPRFIPSSSLVF